MTDPCQYIEAFLHREVPLSKRLGMRAHSYDGECLELHAALEPNINIYGTAFGGSIYSLCALAGWGLLTLKLEELELTPRIMIAAGRIDYSAPVQDTIRACARMPENGVFQEFVSEHRRRVKARIEIPVDILLTDRSAARFTGTYATVSRQR